MTLPQFALKYKKYNVDDLNQFVHQRTGNKRRNLNRFKCIQKLKQLDRDLTFRFLDMAPELRNSIYELVLTHNKDAEKITKHIKPRELAQITVPPTSRAEVALLRVSRQVNQETRGIFLDQSVFFMDQRSVPIHALRHHPLDQRLWWPRRLENLRNITMVIEPYQSLNEWTHTACIVIFRHFNITNALQTLKLIMPTHTENHRTLEDVMKKRLKPLFMLPDATKLEFVGFPPHCEKSVRHAIGRAIEGA